MQRRVLVALAAASCGWPSNARAQDDRPTAAADEHPVRVGVLAGVGFPRPVALEALVKIGDALALGAEYGVLPTATIDGVQLDLWSVAGDLRLFPFGGAFFVGLRAGRQHVGAEASIGFPPYGSATEALALDSWFVNPRLGLLWRARGGFTFGIEAGVQIPVSSTTSSSLPLALVPDAQRTADALGNMWLPTVDLLRIGLLL